MIKNWKRKCLKLKKNAKIIWTILVKLPRRGIITCTVLDSVADGNVMLEELGFLNANE